mmetsp:Transcript_9539/g.31934  ORF Transcript_9539/g.31934 Transcript_9539/m.31934 type:complete len:305 (-) Transcript_9539:905-1819(-)
MAPSSSSSCFRFLPAAGLFCFPFSFPFFCPSLPRRSAVLKESASVDLAAVRIRRSTCGHASNLCFRLLLRRSGALLTRSSITFCLIASSAMRNEVGRGRWTGSSRPKGISSIVPSEEARRSTSVASSKIESQKVNSRAKIHRCTICLIARVPTRPSSRVKTMAGLPSSLCDPPLLFLPWAACRLLPPSTHTSDVTHVPLDTLCTKMGQLRFSMLHSFTLPSMPPVAKLPLEHHERQVTAAASEACASLTPSYTDCLHVSSTQASPPSCFSSNSGRRGSRNIEPAVVPAATQGSASPGDHERQVG